MNRKTISGISENKHALALSGGGFNGSYTMQFLFELRNQYPKFISLLAGTSIGSYNSAILAEVQYLGGTFQDATEHGMELWEKATKKPPMMINIMDTFSLRGLFSTNRVRKFLKEFIDEKRTLADYAAKGITLSIPAADLNSGLAYYFKPETPVIEAMVISGAYPLAFPSQRIPGNNHYFTDGGVLANMPINPLIDAGAESISAFFLSPESLLANNGYSAEEYKSGFSVITRMIDILLLKALRSDINHAELINKLVILRDENKEFLAQLTPEQQDFYLLERNIFKQYNDIKHLYNKRILNLYKHFPSEKLPGTFAMSKKDYNQRIDLAKKDASAYR